MSAFVIKALLDLLIAIYPLLKRVLPTADTYEYDSEVLPTLAMTSVKETEFVGIETPLPYLPKGELPTKNWLTLVVHTINVLIDPKASTKLINESVSSQTEITPVELINEKIKAATEPEDLKDAVFHLLSVLELRETKEAQETPLQSKNDIQLQSNHNEKFQFEEKLNKIDQHLASGLNKQSQQESAISLEADKVDETHTALQRIVRLNVRSLERQLIDHQTDSRAILETTAANPTLKDYEKLINPLNIKPATLTNFKGDQVFAYMQVAGPNPVMLNQIKKIDSRLPITNEQYQKIVSQHSLQDSLEAALQEGRLYLADYSKLGNVSNGSQKYIYAPLALFAVPPDKNTDKNLLPIAIRCQQNPGDENPIFTPGKEDNWMTAKTILQMADSNYHELISHLAQTHLFIEPFVLATNRCFTDGHQVKLLLKPHLEGTVLINYGAHKKLLAREGPIDSLLSGTIESNIQLAITETRSQLANFNDVAFPRALEKRGVNNSKQLPIYPYRDDGKLIWDAIHQWVKEYLDVFYTSDKSVEADASLQNWARELHELGHCNIGEELEGSIRIKTLDYLVDAISTIIFTASAQHAAVNFSQRGLMTYAPAFPLGCYSPAPTKPQQQQNFMGLLPPLDRAELQIQVLYLLGSVYYTTLGEYSDRYFHNRQVTTALRNFQGKLKEIEKTIKKEDRQRLVSYTYLLPSNIPQSINI
jgi:arachidonate 15-lipoxygenase